jgi:hypothetical protein
MGVQRTTGRTVSHAASSKGLSIVVVTRWAGACFWSGDAVTVMLQADAVK